MKKLIFCRRALIRAVHAACIAFAFAVAAARVQGQSFTDPFFQVTGTTYGTHAGTYSSGTFYDPTAPYTVTVGSSTTINATTASHGAFTQFNNAGTNIGVGGGTFTNNGTVTLSLSNGVGYASTVAMYGSASGAASVAVNTGTLQATGAAGPNVAAISFDNSNHGSGSPPPAYLSTPFTLTNSGTLSGTSSGYAFGVHAGGSGSGAITITNEQSGVISGTSSGSYAKAIYAHNNSGDISVTNGGLITATGNATTFQTQGIDANSNGGAVTVTNQASGRIVMNDALSTSFEAAINIQAGLDASGSNAGLISVTTSNGAGTVGISVSGYGNTSIATATNTGTITLNSSGTSFGMTASSYYGTATATNNGTLEIIGNGTSSAYYGTGLGARGNNANAVNNGTLSVTGMVNAIGLSADNSGTANSGPVNATNTGQITVSGSDFAQGITASGYYSLITVNNSGTISATSSGTYGAIGITASTYSQSYGTTFPAPVSITNSGTVTANNTGSSYADAISALTQGDISVTNTVTGVATATATDGNAHGITANSSAGSVTIVNAGRATGTTGSGGYTGYGILSVAGGTNAVTNSGYAGGFNTGGGTGYGIDVAPSGAISVDNSGSAVGTTTGIFLESAGTVNNSGLASGGTYSIQVPTASTVNLNGSSPVQGLLKGGADASSTSDLNFNIAIRGNSLAADRAELNAAIADYNTRYAAADGVGDVDSTVVVLNGINYQWEDFFGIADNLVQGRLYGDTPGFRGLGTAIDNFDPNSVRGNAIVNALANVSDADVAAALAQLSPRTLQVFRNIAFDNATFQANDINNHLANLRDGLTGFDTTGFTAQAAGMDSTLTSIRSHLLAWNPPAHRPGVLSDSTEPLFGAIDAKDMKGARTAEAPEPENRWSTFIAGKVVLANHDNNSAPGTGDTDYTTGTVTAGVDYRLTQHLTLGVLFDYSHTSVDLDDHGSRATVDSYAPGLYASYVDGGWYGNAMATYGFNNDTEDRQISLPGLGGDNHGASSGSQITTNLTGGYEFQRGTFKFGPVATLQYVHLDTGGFQESGPASLSINSQKDDSLRTLIGGEVRFDTTCHTPFGTIGVTPHLQASWQHEYMDNNDGITASFNGTGGGSFLVAGDQPERDSAFVDVGVDGQLAGNVTVFVDYQVQAGQESFFAQGAQGGVRIGF